MAKETDISATVPCEALGGHCSLLLCLELWFITEHAVRPPGFNCETVFILSFYQATYLLTCSVTQNADAVLLSRDKMPSAVVVQINYY